MCLHLWVLKSHPQKGIQMCTSGLCPFKTCSSRAEVGLEFETAGSGTKRRAGNPISKIVSPCSSLSILQYQSPRSVKMALTSSVLACTLEAMFRTNAHAIQPLSFSLYLLTPETEPLAALKVTTVELRMTLNFWPLSLFLLSEC